MLPISSHPAPTSTYSQSPHRRIVVDGTPKFDLEPYINNYAGVTRLERLLFIGTSSRVLGSEALRLAFAEARQGRDINLFKRVVHAQAATSMHEPSGITTPPSQQQQQQQQQQTEPQTQVPPEAVEWVETTSRRVKSEAEKLEHELKGYKNNLIKESIRMGNEDLGAFYYDIGDYAASFKAYSRMREYCTTPKHVAEMGLKLILVAAAQENWMNVQSNVYKLQNSLLAQLTPADRAKIEPCLNPILGLASLALGQYRAAALNLLATDPAFITLEPISSNSGGVTGNTGIYFNKHLLTPNDVAVYGTLCALATFTRSDLTTRVLENAQFRNFLELEPHLRRTVANFTSSKFTPALAILDAYRTDYLLDLHLGRHFPDLYAEIRRRSIVQYFLPYSCVSISATATAFSCSEAEITAELTAMLAPGGVLEGVARLDLARSELVGVKEDGRRKVLEQAIERSAEVERHLRLKMFRTNMMMAGLELRVSKQGLLEGRSVGMRRGKDVV